MRSIVSSPCCNEELIPLDKVTHYCKLCNSEYIYDKEFDVFRRVRI